MKSNTRARPRSASWAGPLALLAVAGAAELGLCWLPATPVPRWPGAGLLALAAVLGLVWLYRVRAARRLFAVLDAYAERELARAKPRGRTPSVIAATALSRSSV